MKRGLNIRLLNLVRPAKLNIKNLCIKTFRTQDEQNWVIMVDRRESIYRLTHISIDWGPDEPSDFIPFFLLPPFFVLLPHLFFLFSGFFSSITGCVLFKCWWMAAKGSDWKAGWLRTVVNCFPSFNLMKMEHYYFIQIPQLGEKGN